MGSLEPAFECWSSVGSLLVPGCGGTAVIDDPNFVPTSVREIAKASFDQYEVCLTSVVFWTSSTQPKRATSPPDRLPQFLSFNKNGLDIDKLLDTIVRQFTAVTTNFDSAKGETRIRLDGSINKTTTCFQLLGCYVLTLISCCHRSFYDGARST